MKILVVEDDELSAYSLTTILTNQNYAVEVATDGDAAWNFIQTYDYDLILLDVVLPKLDGISLCRQIRSSGLQMPILLLTGCDSSHEKAIGLDAGADDYVVKPFDAEELIARVRALLRRKGVTSQPVLEYAELRLDPSSCEAMYAGNLLPLTPKEYALLELFLRNIRRVFSCGMILEHLWCYEDTPQEEAVRTHIKGLRHKLKAVGAPSDLVETVYGIGYRLKPLAEEEKGRGAALLYETLRERLRSVTEEQGGRGELECEKSLVPNLKSQQQTLIAVAEIWQRFQGRVDEQVRVLEEAIATLNHNSLNLDLRSLAAKEAHTLAGSLSTFGLPIGSKLARNIELLLSSSQILSQSEISNLESWVKLLRREIDGNDAVAISSSPTPQVLETVIQPLQNDFHAETKILVVDDDPQIQAFLQTLLSPWGLKAIALEDPRHFWEILEIVTPDMLILDVELPYTNGIELCQLVRNDSRWCELPILFLTVHSDAEMVNQVFSVGADDFVSKPIVGPELVTRIVNRLERMKLRQRVVQGGRGAGRQRSRGAERQRGSTSLRDAARTATLCYRGAGEAGGAGEVNSSLPHSSLNLQAINELELRVAEHTAELIRVNQQLQSQLDERQRTQGELRFSQARFARILDIADLLSNAIKFSSAGSTICLGAQQQGNEVLLAVKNTGRGIPTDKLEGIFECFQQVDSSDSRNHDGTGLSLTICKSIMQQHGGRIWAESVLGEGSTFYVTLPLLRTFQNTDLDDSSNIPVIYSSYEPTTNSQLSPDTEFLNNGRVTTKEFEQRVMKLLQGISLNQQEDSSDDNKANSSG
ncbi:response regulator [Nostoc sp. 'Peltigera malacea cyanobiont' DB3992]|uniref:response regulator n=1 Tax=Nostoc sp. 'Peltigera malacea cyanobiont' DB3992 TaxID=1206980 RepID=UPI00211E59FD|nr:response regulator [Nostoc sp. 'Peltigera malacea cyanobiont' DB3992]